MTPGPSEEDIAEDGLAELHLIDDLPAASSTPTPFRAAPTTFSAALLVGGAVLGVVFAVVFYLPGSDRYPTQILLLPLVAFACAFVGALTAILVIAATWLVSVIAYSADSRFARIVFALLGTLVGVGIAYVLFLLRQGSWSPFVVVFVPTLLVGALQAFILLRQRPVYDARVPTRAGAAPGRLVLSIVVGAGVVVSIALQSAFAFIDSPAPFGQSAASMLSLFTDTDFAELVYRSAILLASIAVVVVFLLRPVRFRLPTSSRPLAYLAAAAFAFGWPTIQYGWLGNPIFDVLISHMEGLVHSSDAYILLPAFGWLVLLLGLVAHLIGLRRMRAVSGALVEDGEPSVTPRITRSECHGGCSTHS